MKRHQALIPLTHDHHHALAHARRLRGAAGGTDEDRLNTSREFLEFFHGDTIRHFREEEEVLFPLVVDEDEARPVLEQVMLEHLRIHATVGALESEVREGPPSEPVMVRAASLLEAHIRFEEKVVFPLIESTVDDADLGSMNLGASGSEA